MLKCPYNSNCSKLGCDLSCAHFSETLHWIDRANLQVKSGVFTCSLKDCETAHKIVEQAINDLGTNSQYAHLSVTQTDNPQYTAECLAYYIIFRYCRGIGFYNGIYKLNLLDYIDRIKASWSTREPSDRLENIKIWIKSSKYLIITNLDLIRFGDFESQTLLSILQDRYGDDNVTIICLSKGQYGLVGKPDSLFFARLKSELLNRGESK